LGRTGYDAQQAPDPVPANRPDNLFDPVPGDYAAHGIFTSQAKNFSLQSWLDLRRRSLGLAAAGLAGLSTLLWRKYA
jgi:hypothetical protein